jgi:hypothetical protein
MIEDWEKGLGKNDYLAAILMELSLIASHTTCYF